MNVVLLRPPYVVARLALTSLTCPPIGLAYVAGSLRKSGVNVRCVDAVGESPFTRLPFMPPDFLSLGLSSADIVKRVGACDVLGVSAMFSQDWPLTRTIIQALRQANPNMTVIAGGEHVTAIPEFCLQDCPALDICVLGEGEETMVDLVGALRNGRNLEDVAGIVYRAGQRIVRTAARARLTSVEEIAWPAWDLLPLENYLANGLGFGVSTNRSMPILASRGCPYQCTFCSSPQMWGTRWQARAPRDLIAEMRCYIERYGAQNFDLYDLTTIIDRKWIVEFCTQLIDERWNVTWQMPSGTRSEALDEEVLQLLYRSGMRNLIYAPESGSERTLKAVKKKVHLPRMTASIGQAVKAGLAVKVNMVIGFPHETRADIRSTWYFLARLAGLGVHDAYVMCFAPYPGSELFAQLRADGKIEDLRDQYFLQLSSTHNMRSRSYCPRLSDAELTASRLAAIFLFYGLNFALRPKRLLELVRNLLRGNEESRLIRSLRSMLAQLFKVKRSQPRAVLHPAEELTAHTSVSH